VFVPGKSLVKVQPHIIDMSNLRKLYVVYMDWGHISLRVVNVTGINLDPLAFILHFFNHVRIASRLVRSFCERMAGSLSMASTAVLTAYVAVVDFGEDGRSAVYSKYNNGHRTLP
jgi:hypothetical protein